MFNIQTKNNGRFKKGQAPWNKGKKTGIVPKTAFKKGEHRSVATEFKKGQNKGEKNIMWSDNPTYRALHLWVALNLGKATYCSNDKSHKSKRFHWANISHKYKRDLNDFKQLCVSCHKIEDLAYGREMSYV